MNNEEIKCPWCGKDIKNFTDFQYLPYCCWEHRDKSMAFNKEYNDMKDGCNAG